MKTIGLTDRKVLLMNRPWDYFTQRIMVPCGRCEECLRQQRNDWYVRLERETKYQKSLHRNSVFVTITIAPAYRDWETDRKSTRLNSSHRSLSRMPSSA